MKRIDTRQELQELARELGVRPDWHEPDEQEVTAVVVGHHFDNAGKWPAGETDPAILEQHVILIRDGVAEGAVNLATLLAWATGYQG